jgi:DHA1 family tetracycline resistance protein-like MFS transporter
MIVKPSQRTTSLTVIFLVVVIDLIGFGMVIPLLPLYAKRYGASPLVIGLLAISYSVTQLLFSPIWGAVSDRIGRRPILLMSLVGSVIFYILFGWAASLLWLFVARLGAGIFAANISAAMAYIADITTRENRARGMGLVGAAFGIGFIIGPAVGGFLGQVSYSLPGYAAAALSFAALLLAFFKLPESLKSTMTGKERASFKDNFWQPVKRAVCTPNLARLLLIYFLVIFAFASMQVTFPLYTHETFGFDVKQNGYIFAFVGILGIIFQGGLIGKMSKVFGDGPLTMVGTALSMIGFSLIPFAETVPWLLMFMALLGIGTGLNTPTLTSLVSLSTGESSQGSVLGVSRSIATLARIVGPLWGGWAYGAWGKSWPYWSAGGVLLIAVIIGWPFWRCKLETDFL